MNRNPLNFSQEEIDTLRDAAQILLDALPSHDEVYHTFIVPFVPNPEQTTAMETF